MSHLAPDEAVRAALDDPTSTPSDVREHLQGCAECSAEVAALRRPVTHLRGLGPDPEPPPGVWDAVQREIARDRESDREQYRVPAPRRRPPARRRILVAAGALAVVLIGGVALALGLGRPDPVPTGTTVAMRSAPGVEASMAPVTDRPGMWQVDVVLPAPLPGSEEVEVWRQDGARLVTVGRLESAGADRWSGTLMLGPPGSSEVDISVEERDGDTTHSGRSIAHSP